MLRTTIGYYVNVIPLANGNFIDIYGGEEDLSNPRLRLGRFEKTGQPLKVRQVAEGNRNRAKVICLAFEQRYPRLAADSCV